MHLKKRITAFAELGKFLNQFATIPYTKNETVKNNDLFFDAFKKQITIAHENNGWFTQKNITYAINNWANALNENNLNTWLKNYKLKHITAKQIAVIMAGNIPLVGFHDFLSVLICGHQIRIKQSSNDKHLLPFLAKYLENVEPYFKGRIQFNDGKLDKFDAVIATGSNNTARYFEYYFKSKPAIIRKNRNSVAVLTGNETKVELEALANDVFQYYGLGCRNVSKLYVPDNYNFDAFFNAMYSWRDIINETKYANNYDYNKAVYLMSEFNMLDNGFLIVKKDTSIASPIAIVFYEYYNKIEELKSTLKASNNNIQCIVGNGVHENEINFGQTQNPKLWDYADQIDTISFLLKI